MGAATQPQHIARLRWPAMLGTMVGSLLWECVSVECCRGEIFFARTFADDVGCDWSGCEQGRCGCWFAIRAKNVSPLHLLVVLGLTGRVVNRVCGVAGCDRGEKYFGRTLGCALGGRAIKYDIHAGERPTMRQPSAQGL